MAVRRFVPVLALLSLPLAAAQIPTGAHVLLRMVNSVNTRNAQEGDYVYLRTASPITVDGKIVVPVESYVQGIVSHIRRSGRVTGRAELGIRLETLTLKSGQTLKFSPHLSSADSIESEHTIDRSENLIRESPNKADDARRIAILAGSGAAIGGVADRAWQGAGIRLPCAPTRSLVPLRRPTVSVPNHTALHKHARLYPARPCSTTPKCPSCRPRDTHLRTPATVLDPGSSPGSRH